MLISTFCKKYKKKYYQNSMKYKQKYMSEKKYLWEQPKSKQNILATLIKAFMIDFCCFKMKGKDEYLWYLVAMISIWGMAVFAYWLYWGVSITCFPMIKFLVWVCCCYF
jgi:hypothetical protein